MESDEGWVMLDSDNPADSDDDGGVLALSSSCPTPDASDDDEVVGDDGEGLYDPEDAEEDEQPRPPPPKPLSGLFHHTPSSAASYSPFDALRSAKQLIPDPAFSVFPEEVTVLASTRGLVCLRGRTTGLYYITNPVTFKRVRLPPPNREHRLLRSPVNNWVLLMVLRHSSLQHHLARYAEVSTKSVPARRRFVDDEKK